MFAPIQSLKLIIKINQWNEPCYADPTNDYWINVILIVVGAYVDRWANPDGLWYLFSCMWYNMHESKMWI